MNLKKTLVIFSVGIISITIIYIVAGFVSAFIKNFDVMSFLCGLGIGSLLCSYIVIRKEK